MNNENYERRLRKEGNAPVARVAGMEGALDLLDSLNFFSVSAFVVRTADKFCHHRENR